MEKEIIQPQPDHLSIEDELKTVADAIKKDLSESHSVTAVISMNIKAMIFPPALKQSIIGSSTMAMAEIFFKIQRRYVNRDSIDQRYAQKEDTFTYVIFHDTSPQHQKACSTLRNSITMLKFDKELPCELSKLVTDYILPKPDHYDNFAYVPNVRPIPVVNLPGISTMHRRSKERQWELIDTSRINCLFRGLKSKEINKIIGKINYPTLSQSALTFDKEDSNTKICAVLSCLLEERQNPASRLSFLPVEIIQEIYTYIFIFWETHIETQGIFASIVSKVEFPKPKGINCNMMPIQMFDVNSIPDNMRQYLPLLAACPLNREEFWKIGYLTIHESVISNEGQSQRRGGIHTETPGKIWLEGYKDQSLPQDVAGTWQLQTHAPLTVAWGRGIYDSKLESHYEYIGGLYMASNVADSTRIWNCKVKNPADVVGPLGDLQHMKSYLGDGETLDAGEMVWITDCTPHESLPLPAGTYRQYFRLVTSDVSVWYADHSTPNPLGIVPPDNVKIVHGNKFNALKKEDGK